MPDTTYRGGPRAPHRACGLIRGLLRALPLVAQLACDARAETITQARYAEPVERYGHFAPGRPHEYARLTVVTDDARTLGFELPPDEVFEDIAPRLVNLSTGAPPQLLAIISSRQGGARLALIQLRDGVLAIDAQSRPIGTPMRWLNPVGVVDLDGDGEAEIAAVITPHLGGPLKVYRRVYRRVTRQGGAELVEIASLAGFSNHLYGSSELALSIPLTVAGAMRLVVPDATRTHLRVVGMLRGRLVETARCALTAPINGAIRILSPGVVSVGLASGRERVALGDCPAPP